MGVPVAQIIFMRWFWYKIAPQPERYKEGGKGAALKFMLMHSSNISFVVRISYFGIKKEFICSNSFFTFHILMPFVGIDFDVFHPKSISGRFLCMVNCHSELASTTYLGGKNGFMSTSCWSFFNFWHFHFWLTFHQHVFNILTTFWTKPPTASIFVYACK